MLVRIQRGVLFTSHHGLNRGNARTPIFDTSDDDDEAFERILEDALECVSLPLSVVELTAIRLSVHRGQPRGHDGRVQPMVRRFGLESTPHPAAGSGSR